MSKKNINGTVILAKGIFIDAKYHLSSYNKQKRLHGLMRQVTQFIFLRRVFSNS